MRLLSVLVFISAAGAVESNAVDVPEIIRKSVEATENNFTEAQKYTFIEHDIVSKKDGPKTSKTYQVLLSTVPLTTSRSLMIISLSRARSKKTRRRNYKKRSTNAGMRQFRTARAALQNIREGRLRIKL